MKRKARPLVDDAASNIAELQGLTKKDETRIARELSRVVAHGECLGIKKRCNSNLKPLRVACAVLFQQAAKPMAFVANAETIAREAMNKIDVGLSDKYASVVRFLSSHPEAASAMRGKSAPPVGSADYVREQASALFKSRNARTPKLPETIPDEMVSVILVSYFGIPQADAERVKREHQLSMGAENLVGDLLERYLASVMEPKGWIWCSGAMVKAVDFIKPPASPGKEWTLLQVKNRDNSENSSSSAIRVGTTIEKWHRTFSKKKGSNWGAFPDASLRQFLSEADFKLFVREYLGKLR